MTLYHSQSSAELSVNCLFRLPSCLPHLYALGLLSELYLLHSTGAKIPLGSHQLALSPRSSTPSHSAHPRTPVSASHWSSTTDHVFLVVVIEICHNRLILAPEVLSPHDVLLILCLLPPSTEIDHIRIVKVLLNLLSNCL